METDLIPTFLFLGALVHGFGLGALWMHYFVWYDAKYGFKNQKLACNICIYAGYLLCFYPGMWYYRKIYNERKKELEK